MLNYPGAGALLFLSALGLMTVTIRAAETAATRLPSMAVVSPGVPGENKMVGTYAQPEWSARRPFPGVSVYVAPAGQFELETGFQDATTPGGTNHREWSQEFEAGLGHRWQAAVENTRTNFSEGARRPLRWHEDSLELSARYALADWGKLPLNPALGAGWRFNSGAADAPLAQLVLGGELTPRLHWAADFQYGRQTGGPRLRELTAATALTYSVTNETLNIGLQAQSKRSSELLDPASVRSEIGPCLQYRPRDQIHLDCVALWGTERGRSVHGFVLSVGFEFGEGADDHDDDRERGGRLAH
jgi:hypothetical protein